MWESGDHPLTSMDSLFRWLLVLAFVVPPLSVCTITSVLFQCSLDDSELSRRKSIRCPVIHQVFVPINTTLPVCLTWNV